MSVTTYSGFVIKEDNSRSRGVRLAWKIKITSEKTYLYLSRKRQVMSVTTWVGVINVFKQVNSHLER